jgi:hypothetical protein
MIWREVCLECLNLSRMLIRVTYNGSWLCEGWDLEFVCFNFVQMYIRITKVEFITTAQLSQNQC